MPAPDSFFGRTISHYEVLEKLGSGGMGVVYRARDANLERPVAIKFLPDELLQDEDALWRFRREARAASALNHPGICTIYEIGDDSGRPYLVMELLEGESLDRAIARREMEVSDILSVSIGVAEALDAAHAGGIVHRDIKPPNIFLTKHGRPKVLDFGLAKVNPALWGSTSDAGAPSAETRQKLTLTQRGTIMGTVHYMSPEQARGQALDSRSDLFSFGVVLYEMVTGQLPFHGATGLMTIDAILHQNSVPPVRLNPDVPEALDSIVARCLEKNRDLRYQHASDLASDLKRLKRDLESQQFVVSTYLPEADAASERSGTTASAVRRTSDFAALQVEESARGPGRGKAASIAGVLAAVALVSGALYWRLGSLAPPAAAPPAMVLRAFSNFRGERNMPAFSPDGNTVAFSWNGPAEDNTDIYVKLVDSGEPVRLTTHPDFETGPVFSPDGRRIAFTRFTDTRSGFISAVYVIPALGGPEQRIADGWACDWTPDGKALVIGAMENGVRVLSVVDIESAMAVRLPVLPGGLGPTGTARVGGSIRLSPDGKWLYATAERSASESGLHRLAFPDGAWQPVRLEGLAAIASFDLSPDGSELVVVGNSQPNERRRLYRAATNGGAAKPLPFGDGSSSVKWAPRGNMLAFVSSARIQALYRIPIPIRARQSPQPERWIASRFVENSPAFSRDGRFLLVSSERSGTSQIYRSDAEGHGAVQLTKLNGVTVGSPVWSPDGQRIVFDARVDGNADIWVMDGDGSNQRRVTVEPSEDVTGAWAPDGNSIVFCSNRSGSQQLWRAPLSGGPAVQLTRDGAFGPRLSPDGKFFYYLRSRAAGGLRRAPVDGGREEDLLPTVVDRNWTVTADGIYIFQMESGATGLYGVNRRAELLYYDLRSRRLSKTGFTSPQRIGNNGIAVSADGSRLVFPQLEDAGSGITIVEHFR
jgi:serine/threonine protein kinase/Tol biopolymer transport system component